MKTKKILLQPKSANRAFELFDEHDLPINMTRGKAMQTNDSAKSKLVPITLEYKEDDEQLIEWLIDNI